MFLIESVCFCYIIPPMHNKTAIDIPAYLPAELNQDICYKCFRAHFCHASVIQLCNSLLEYERSANCLLVAMQQVITVLKHGNASSASMQLSRNKNSCCFFIYGWVTLNIIYPTINASLIYFSFCANSRGYSLQYI